MTNQRNRGSLHEIMTSAKIIDLTAIIGPDYPCFYFRGQPFKQVQLQDYDGPRGFYISNILIMEEHCGTHCDAPIHMIPPVGSDFPHAGRAHDITVDKIPLEKCLGPAAVIDCRDLLGTEKPGYSPVITTDKLKRWEEKYGKLQKEDKVLLFTSWTEIHYKKFPEGYKLSESEIGTVPRLPLEEGIKPVEGEDQAGDPLELKQPQQTPEQD